MNAGCATTSSIVTGFPTVAEYGYHFLWIFCRTFLKNTIIHDRLPAHTTIHAAKRETVFYQYLFFFL